MRRSGLHRRPFLALCLPAAVGRHAGGNRLSGNLWVEVCRWLMEPDKVVEYANSAPASPPRLASWRMMPNDASTRFKGKPGQKKSVCLVGADFPAGS